VGVAPLLERRHLLLVEDTVNRIKSSLALALLTVLAAGCSGGGAGTVPSTTNLTPASSSRAVVHTNDTLGGVGNIAPAGGMSVFLTDAPPVLGSLTPTAINLGIDAVKVEYDGHLATIASYSTPYVVNVMENPGNPSSPIGIGQAYSGIYHRVVFVIDAASSNVVANGQTYPIQFEGGEKSESTIGAGRNTRTTVDDGTVTMSVEDNFLVDDNPAAAVQADFNAYESLALVNGQIVARPTLFAVPDSVAGKIDGTVTNANGSPVVGATVAAFTAYGHLANTTATDANGNFDLHTLRSGSYRVIVLNQYTTASGQTLNATGNSNSNTFVAGPWVTVQAGQTTQTGSIAD
jgi:hypothetical protein